MYQPQLYYSRIQPSLLPYLHPSFLILAVVVISPVFSFENRINRRIELQQLMRVLERVSACTYRKVRSRACVGWKGERGTVLACVAAANGVVAIVERDVAAGDG